MNHLRCLTDKASWQRGRAWLVRSRAACVVAGLLLAAPGRPAQAQQVLVHANVADDTVKTTFGPNRRYFGHFYTSYCLVSGAAETGAAVRYGPSSSEIRTGARLKRRFNQVLAVNLDLGYAYLVNALVQSPQKTLPSAVQHRSESLRQHQLYSDLGVRLNVGRRGNYVGRYLDLLGGVSRNAATAHRTEDDPAPGIGSVETTERGLPYLRPWTFGAGARLGIDRYALTGRYRLTSAFQPQYGYAELPRWLLGLEIGLF